MTTSKPFHSGSPQHTWNTGTQSHEGNGSHRVLQTDRTAEVRGKVTDKGSKKTNAQNRDYKRWVTLGDVCWVGVIVEREKKKKIFRCNSWRGESRSRVLQHTILTIVRHWLAKILMLCASELCSSFSMICKPTGMIKSRKAKFEKPSKGEIGRSLSNYLHVNDNSDKRIKKKKNNNQKIPEYYHRSLILRWTRLEIKTKLKQNKRFHQQQKTSMRSEWI